MTLESSANTGALAFRTHALRLIPTPCRPEAYLTAFLVLSTISAIGIAIALSILHLWTTQALTVARTRDGHVATPPLLVDEMEWHLFISHVWTTVRHRGAKPQSRVERGVPLSHPNTTPHVLQGQDQCRIIKSRLHELVPGLHTFLDVDDLKDIAGIRAAVHASCAMLVFMSRGYFLSRGCSAHADAIRSVNEAAPWESTSVHSCFLTLTLNAFLLSQWLSSMRHWRHL